VRQFRNSNFEIRIRPAAILVVALAISILAMPLAAEAQQAGRVYRIGFLGATSASGYAPQVQAFRGGLRDLGYVEGKNLVIDFRWAEGNYARLPELAAELVLLKPDVLVTHAPAGTLAAKRATATIPIVMGVVGDAVAMGRASRALAGTLPGRPSFSRSSTPNGSRYSRRRFRA